MSALEKITAILKDPPPEFVFEISADGIAMSRTRPPSTVQYQALAPGVLTPSPLKENVLDADAFAEAVRKLVPPGAGRRRKCALLLPDNALRVAVLDFESIPAKEEERQSLIRFRMRKTLPFDIDEAALSYHIQGNRIIAAVTPREIIARYEAPFRAANLYPGFITSSSLALLELLPPKGFILVAHRTPGTLTALAVRDGSLALFRTIELNETEIADDLYPTLIYLEDQTGERPGKLLLVGQVSDVPKLSAELAVPVESLPDPYPAIQGYLQSIHPAAKKAAA